MAESGKRLFGSESLRPCRGNCALRGERVSSRPAFFSPSHTRLSSPYRRQAVPWRLAHSRGQAQLHLAWSCFTDVLRSWQKPRHDVAPRPGSRSGFTDGYHSDTCDKYSWQQKFCLIDIIIRHFLITQLSLRQ